MSRSRRIAVGLLLLMVVVGLLLTTDLRAWIGSAAEQLKSAGPGGKAVFGLVYAAATVLFLPASVITLASGFAWGPLQGVLVVWPSATIGAVGAFLLGRTLLRDVVEARVSKDPRFQAIEGAVQRDGLQLVLLLRLSPLFPFNALNYALGLTSVSLRDYTLGTAIGILPGTALYVWIGSTVSDLAAVLSGTAAPTDTGDVGRWAWWLGLLATVAVSVQAARIGRAALAAQLVEEEPAESNDDQP